MYTAVLSSYADDNNLYAIGNDKEETKRALVKGFQTVLNWFYKNYDFKYRQMPLNVYGWRCGGKPNFLNVEPTKND